MACYIVNFELKDDSRLPALEEALKSFRGSCPLTSHSWAIATEENAKDVRNQLAEILGTHDQLFVLRSGTEGAWQNAYSEKHNDWLKKHL